MRCRFCKDKAVIHMRQHKLALCMGHFLDWLPAQVERTIQRYKMFTKEDRILVAVSGGKDSLSLWEILQRLGYITEGLYIGLGIDEGTNYSKNSQDYAFSFARQHRLCLHVMDIKAEFGESIPRLAERTHRGRNKPCSVCGVTKRHVMNLLAKENGYTALATGHNLDDEAAVLFGNTLRWSSSYLVRQGPVLEADLHGFVRKVKPLCRMYEREMAAYAFLRRIAHIQDECPFAVDANSIYHKEILDKLESDRPGTKLSFYLSFLQARKNGLFSNSVDTREAQLHACPQCGQPTTVPGLCAFCRMLIKPVTAELPINMDKT